MVEIFKGDDTDFAGAQEIKISIRTALDLSEFRGEFAFMGVKREFGVGELTDKLVTISYTAEETGTFCLGQNTGTFTLWDGEGRKAAVCKVLVLVKSHCLCCGMPENAVEISIENAYNYEKLENLPKINGVEVIGEKTGREYKLQRIPRFSPESTYEVGEQVVYGSSIFECVKDVTTPGAFVDGDWTMLSNGIGSVEDVEKLPETGVPDVIYILRGTGLLYASEDGRFVPIGRCHAPLSIWNGNDGEGDSGSSSGEGGYDSYDGMEEVLIPAADTKRAGLVRIVDSVEDESAKSPGIVPSAQAVKDAVADGIVDKRDYDDLSYDYPVAKTGWVVNATTSPTDTANLTDVKTVGSAEVWSGRSKGGSAVSLTIMPSAGFIQWGSGSSLIQNMTATTFTAVGYNGEKRDDIEVIVEDKIALESDVESVAAGIEAKIPAEASSDNQLADKEWVDEAIESVASYYITSNVAGDAFATHAALVNAQTYYSGGKVRIPTRNDYAVVLADETHGGVEYRYVYAVPDGDSSESDSADEYGQWEAQYPIETNDYQSLSNKPSVNGVELSGNKTLDDLGARAYGDLSFSGLWKVNVVGLVTEPDSAYLAGKETIPTPAQMTRQIKWTGKSNLGKDVILRQNEYIGSSNIEWVLTYDVGSSSQAQWTVTTAKTPAPTALEWGDAATGEKIQGDSLALSSEVAKKVDKVSGKGLSTNDFTDTDKTKLDGIASGAQVNVIETVKVNGTPLVPEGKAVNVVAATPADATLTDRFSEWAFTKTLTAENKAALYAEDPLAAEDDYALSIRYEDSDYCLYVGEYMTAILGSADNYISCYIDHYVSSEIINVWAQDTDTVATRTALPGYRLGPDSQDNPNRNKFLASEAEAESLRDNVAALQSGKQDTLTPTQLANIAAVPNKADESDLRYALISLSVTPGTSGWTANYSEVYDGYGNLKEVNMPAWSTESTPDGDKTGWFWYGPDYVYRLLSEDQSATTLSEYWEGEDPNGEYVEYNITFTLSVSPATATLADRAVNELSLSGETILALPSPQSGHSRDFYICATASADSAITVTGATLIDAQGGAVSLSAPANATTTWRLTESKEATTNPSANPVFVVTGANSGKPQVQANWNETDTTSPAYIQNKPTIPAAQVNADWNAVSGVAQILNKPTIPSDKPTRIYNAAGTDALDDKGQLFKSVASGNYWTSTVYSTVYTWIYAGIYGSREHRWNRSDDSSKFITYDPQNGDFRHHPNSGSSSPIGTLPTGQNPTDPACTFSSVGGYTFTPIHVDIDSTPYAYFALESLPDRTWAAGTWAIGDLVKYSGKAYRCKAATSSSDTTAPSSDTTHWEEIPVLSEKAPLASPAFTGTPTAPTPTAGDSSTKVATTAFVNGEIAGKANSSSIAPEFSTASTYAVDDVVMHEGLRYRCTTAVTTAGAWDSSNWTAETVQSALGGTDPTNKLNSTSAAPDFSSTATYDVGNYCTYLGVLYECVVAKTTASATTPDQDIYDSSHTSNHWKVTDMTTPDATVDVTADDQLRLVGADGTLLWQEGYDLKTTTSATPSNKAVNAYSFAANATDEVAITLPSVTSGKVGDFIIDVTNPALDSTAASYPSAFSDSATYAVGDKVAYNSKIWRCTTAISTAGAWTGSTNWEEAWPYFTIAGLDSTVSVVVPKGENLTDILSFAPGTMCELLITLSAFTVNSKPTWSIGRRDVENGGASA